MWLAYGKIFKYTNKKYHLKTAALINLSLTWYLNNEMLP